MPDGRLTIFGFEITRKKPKNQQETEKSFAIPSSDDGAVTIQRGSHYGTYVDLDGVVRNEIELITRYRQMAMQPELETAIDEIINEAIVTEDNGHAVDINLDEVKKASDNTKKKIEEEFQYILKLLGFKNASHDIFRKWYIDGRIFYHVVIDEKAPAKGIQSLKYIDPRRIRKIREITKQKDEKTGMEIVNKIVEYYLYNERGVIGTHSQLGSKIAVDSIVNTNSGLMDSKRALVLSYLHKAIKPLNQLRMMEDATVIYRLSRAPERRIFYVDVGNMPTIKAEQYLRDIMVQYRNKLVYDATTGEIKDDRKHLSMLEDFWLPRREGSRGTEISTLPGGQNLGKMEDVEYFEKKLYKALGVPISRLEENQGFTAGRTTEITRDELKFAKFISRLRNKFSQLFNDLLRVQLVLKKICTEDEWKEWREELWYDFLKDNNFDEFKDAELLTNRITNINLIQPYVGLYYSKEWVRKNVLMQSDDDIEEIDGQIDQEKEDDPIDPMQQAMLPPPVPGNPMAQQMLPPPDQQQQAGGEMDPMMEEPIIPSKFEVQPEELVSV
jgi:hypothetical protein